MILEVIVNISNSDVDRTFDYEGDDVPIGSRVVVEFGKKRLIGFVIGKKEKSEFSDLKRAQYLDSPISQRIKRPRIYEKISHRRRFQNT